MNSNKSSILVRFFFIVIYIIGLHNLYKICKWGKIKENIIMLIICILLLIVYLVFRIREKVQRKDKEKYNKVLIYISLALIILSTIFYGYKIYNTAINYNGKLAWYLDELKNQQKIKFTHNNIYEDGIEGIFEDISSEESIPDELYISNKFQLQFRKDGTITDFYTFIYGKDENGEIVSLLINYDKKKSDKIIVEKNRYAGNEFSEDMLLKPLRDTMKVIPLKDTISNWSGDKYGIVYFGRRSWGYNTEGIKLINNEGEIRKLNMSNEEIVGYTVSIYVPGEEDKITPIRYNLVNDFGNAVMEEDKHDNSKFDTDTAEEFYLSNSIGYRLVITGAATGSRYYALYKTTNGGIQWDIASEDPFSGKGGGSNGMSFLNEDVGFFSLSRSGGTYGELYRTDDGGKTITQVELPYVNVNIEGQSYNVFDMPNVPYEEDGALKLLVGQGSDGDYNKGCNALYISRDKGLTWEFVKETID